MLKKITTLISKNNNDLTRKLLVLGGITVGIAISSVLNKIEEPDIVVTEEIIEVDEKTTDENPTE